MIEFFADEHFRQHPGKVLYEGLPDDLKPRTAFYENGWDVLESGLWEPDCELLILHMIAGTGNQPMPGAGAEAAVKRYCERGGNLLLLHGSSAAFWGWRWWREIVGFRWVRPGDPDNPDASCHPHHPCAVKRAKTRHALAAQLTDFELPEDEIYIHLEETAPTMTLMETTIPEGTFPQCAETVDAWGGKIVSFIPGHLPVCTENPILQRNVAVLIRYLLQP